MALCDVRWLKELGIAYEYAEHPGAHDWDYWDAHVRDALAFHTKVLRIHKTGTENEVT